MAAVTEKSPDRDKVKMNKVNIYLADMKSWRDLSPLPRSLVTTLPSSAHGCTVTSAPHDSINTAHPASIPPALHPVFRAPCTHATSSASFPVEGAADAQGGAGGRLVNSQLLHTCSRRRAGSQRWRPVVRRDTTTGRFAVSQRQISRRATEVGWNGWWWHFRPIFWRDLTLNCSSIITRDTVNHCQLLILNVFFRMIFNLQRLCQSSGVCACSEMEASILNLGTV